MSNAILYRMASGIQGAVSREDNNTIESVPYGSSAFPTYGVPYKYSSGTIVPIAANDTADSVMGLLIRPFPLTGGNTLGTSTPPTTGIANGLRRGFATVVCNNGTPALGGQVYVRIDTPSGAKVVGGIEATSDSTHTIAPAGWFFNGVADANGNVEIQINL